MINKSTIVAAIAAVLVGAGVSPASANTYPFAGNVAPTCSIGGSTSGASTSVSGVVTGSGNNGDPPSSLSVSPASIAVLCNRTNIRLTVSSPALYSSTSSGGSNPRVMNYRITVSNWTATPIQFTTNEQNKNSATTIFSGSSVNSLPSVQSLAISADNASTTDSQGKVRTGTYNASVSLSLSVVP